MTSSRPRHNIPSASETRSEPFRNLFKCFTEAFRNPAGTSSSGASSEPLRMLSGMSLGPFRNPAGKGERHYNLQKKKVSKALHVGLQALLQKPQIAHAPSQPVSGKCCGPLEAFSACLGVSGRIPECLAVAGRMGAFQSASGHNWKYLCVFNEDLGVFMAY